MIYTFENSVRASLDGIMWMTCTTSTIPRLLGLAATALGPLAHRRNDYNTEMVPTIKPTHLMNNVCTDRYIYVERLFVEMRIECQKSTNQFRQNQSPQDFFYTAFMTLESVTLAYHVKRQKMKGGFGG